MMKKNTRFFSLLFLFLLIINIVNCKAAVSAQDEFIQSTRRSRGDVHISVQNTLTPEVKKSQRFKDIVHLSQIAFPGISEGQIVEDIVAEAEALSGKYGVEIKPDDLVLGVDFKIILPGIQKKIIQTKKKAPSTVGIGGGGGFINVVVQALRGIFDRNIAIVPGTDNGGSSGRLKVIVSPHLGYVFGVGDGMNVLVETIPEELHSAKDKILSTRPQEVHHNGSTYKTVYNVLRKNATELAEGERIYSQSGGISDFYFFIANQLNIARIIDKSFIENDTMPDFYNIAGQSIRNLNALAVFHSTGVLLEGKKTNIANADSAMHLLEMILGVEVNSHGDTIVHPVVSLYDEAVTYAVYDRRLNSAEKLYISNRLRGYLKLYPHAIQDIVTSQGKLVTVVFGQQFFDQIKHSSRIEHFGLVRGIPDYNVWSVSNLDSLDVRDDLQVPSEVIEAISTAEDLITVGAGSLYSSLLCQLAIPEVAQALAARRAENDIPIVFILNMVLTDETQKMTGSMYIDMIERETGYKIEELFTHVVANDALVAIAIEEEMGPPYKYMEDLIRGVGVERVGVDMYKLPGSPIEGQHIYVERFLSGLYFTDARGDPIFITPEGRLSKDSGEQGVIMDGNGETVNGKTVGGIYLNPYTYYMLTHPELQNRIPYLFHAPQSDSYTRILDENMWAYEMGLAGFMYMSDELYAGRGERGRNRGALFLTDDVIESLQSNGMQVILGRFADWQEKTKKQAGQEVAYEYFVGLNPGSIRWVLKDILDEWTLAKP